MKNLLPVIRFKMSMSTSTSSAKITTSQNNRAYLKPYQVQPTHNLPAKTVPTKKYRSLKNSFLVISSVCKGVILCPGARNLTDLISIFKRHPIFRYAEDDPPGQIPRERQHEQILVEQQKQLEKLKKEIKARESVEKFPKYKPK